MLTQARAQEAWDARGVQWELKGRLTGLEEDAVRAQWAEMAGTSTWMDAFFRFLHGRADAVFTGESRCGQQWLDPRTGEILQCTMGVSHPGNCKMGEAYNG